MKVKCRVGTFETNSSSTHSITICTKKEFENWKKGLMAYDADTRKLVDISHGIDRKQIAEKSKNVYTNGDPYRIPWDDLSEQQRETFIDRQTKIALEKYLNENDFYSFDAYYYSYQEGCEYSEISYTTEHGDEIVAFGKGGYD